MRLAAARQVAVLAPAFAAHTAWIAPFSLRIGPNLDVCLEDAVGAAAMLWLVPRCRQAFVASLPELTTDKQLLRPRELLAVVVALLLRYVLAGYLGNGLEQLFAAAVPTQTSARVAAQALGHLAWQAMALQLLGQRLAFFSADAEWLSIRWDGPWLRWVLAGFAASATAYSLAAEVGPLFCSPATGFADASAAESVIVPMVRSEDGFMRTVGYMSSCVSGPAVEEIVHRGFLLTALRRLMPVRFALPASAALFALQHGHSAQLLPLGALGLLWSLLYLGSGNLLVSMLTHGLWNLRVLILNM
jgi:membrane protease YdiL (CAAX protease family)